MGGQRNKQKRPSSSPHATGLTRSSSIRVAYAPQGIDADSTTGPKGRQGGVLCASVGFQRPAPPPLLPPRSAEQRKDQAGQDERAKESRRLHEVGMEVMMSESAHNGSQYITPGKRPAVHGASKIFPLR